MSLSAFQVMESCMNPAVWTSVRCSHGPLVLPMPLKCVLGYPPLRAWVACLQMAFGLYQWRGPWPIWSGKLDFTPYLGDFWCLRPYHSSRQKIRGASTSFGSNGTGGCPAAPRGGGSHPGLGRSWWMAKHRRESVPFWQRPYLIVLNLCDGSPLLREVILRSRVG